MTPIDAIHIDHIGLTHAEPHTRKEHRLLLAVLLQACTDMNRALNACARHMEGYRKQGMTKGQALEALKKCYDWRMVCQCHEFITSELGDEILDLFDVPLPSGKTPADRIEAYGMPTLSRLPAPEGEAENEEREAA